jgi:hypothetical protein
MHQRSEATWEGKERRVTLLDMTSVVLYVNGSRPTVAYAMSMQLLRVTLAPGAPIR